MALSHSQVLGVSPLADEEQLRTAFKKRVLETHPDKGGDVEEFRCVKEAYEALQKMRAQRERASQRQADFPKPGNAASHSPGPPPPFFEQMIFQLSERAQLRHPRPQRSMEEEIAAAFDSIPWRRVTVAAAADANSSHTSSASQASSPKAKANATKGHTGTAGRKRSAVKGGAEPVAPAARSSSDPGSGRATCSSPAAPQSAAKRWQVLKARAASLPAEVLWKYISQLSQSDEREKAIQSLNEATQSKLFQYLKERQSERQHKFQKGAASQTAPASVVAPPVKVVPGAKLSGQKDAKPSGRKHGTAAAAAAAAAAAPVVKTAGRKGVVAASVAAKAVKPLGKRAVAVTSTPTPPKSSSSSSSEEESSSSSSESTEEFVVDEPIAASRSLR